jgi:iron complex outermembrane recepter protein
VAPEASHGADAAVEAARAADAGSVPPVVYPVEVATAQDAGVLPDAELGSADAGETAAPSDEASEAAPESKEPEALGEVIVTGVRGGGARSIADSPSPIDVIGHEEIMATGRTGLKEILGALVPSMNMPAQGGGGTSASVRPYTYRGLSGDYLLVLVNGKRRHTTALINNLSRVSGGSTPVDLDLIPASAIKRIEILRDGAAAQYGSDAISGVLNIILDDTPEGLNFQQMAGKYYEKGGPTVQQQLSVGTPLGKSGGFIRLSADARYRERAKSSGSPILDKRANGAPNYYYPPISATEPDPREAEEREKVHAGGYGRSNRDLILATALNTEIPVTDRAKLYSFGTLTYRDVKDARGFIVANRNDSLPERYPNGFQAFRRIYEWDGQGALGVKHQIRGWDWDLNTGYGRDYVKLGAENTLNPSLGPTSPTKFVMGKQVQDLVPTSLDLTKGYRVGLSAPLNVSLGFMHRWEQFQNRKGEPDSYRDGGYQVPLGTDPFHQAPLPMGVGGFGGTFPNPGLVSFTGTSPDDARKLHRNNYAGYLDLNTDILRDWYVGAAGRFEHYDDSAGNVVSGKLATRYEIIKGLGVRAGINSGFRAPSLAQTAFSTTQVTGTIIGGERITTRSKFLPVDSDAAKALGASPLKPEKSWSVTGGITYELSRLLRITLDGYQTKVDGRIAKTEFLGTANNGGVAVRELLRSQGIDDVDSAQFHFNAMDTTTRGFDVVAEYTLRSDNFGTFRPSVAYSYARTFIDKVTANPEELAGLDVTLFGRQARIDTTSGMPRSKAVISGNWTIWRFATELRVTRYGKYTEASTTAGFDQYFSAKWITDLDVGYGITDAVKLSVGAYNLFNVYPDRVGIVSQDGSGQYGSFAPFGFSGGFYYARLNVNI